MHTILIITAGDCPPCKQMRGTNGNFVDTGPLTIPGGDRWNSQFFLNLLTAGKNDKIQRFQVYELHFPTRASIVDIANIDSFSIFSIFVNKEAYVDKLTYTNDKTRLQETREVNGRRTEDKYYPGNLATFFNTKLQLPDISKYILGFPCWLFYDNLSYVIGVCGNDNYAVEKGKIVPRDTHYGVITTAAKIVDGSLSLSLREEKVETMQTMDICKRRIRPL